MFEIVKSQRGFAVMDPELQKRIARMGGIAAQKSGKAYRWTVEKAREAGRKGGKVTKDKHSKTEE